MNKKRIGVILCLVALAVGALALGRQSQTGQTQTAQPSPPQRSAEVPDHIAYRHLFNHVLAFKKRADEEEKQGKDGTAFRNFFRRKAELKDEQGRALEEIAADCDQEVKRQDALAKVVIDTYKAQYPNGKVPHGESPKPPPAELKSMTEERKVIILRARDRLHATLGDEEFNRFDGFVKRYVAPNVNQASASH